MSIDFGVPGLFHCLIKRYLKHQKIIIFAQIKRGVIDERGEKIGDMLYSGIKGREIGERERVNGKGARDERQRKREKCVFPLFRAEEDGEREIWRKNEREEGRKENREKGEKEGQRKKNEKERE